ncbi:hypothetical protein [Pseudoalteromonas denitrificans]|nr:hypothetical protein [Pseudoalteromonas denitrificans]
MNITLVGSIVVGFFVMVLLYMRGENFRKELDRTKALYNKVSRETQYLTNVVLELAKEEQRILYEKFTRFQKRGSPNVELLKFTGLLIEAYEVVISETTVGQRTVHEAFKEYANHNTNIGFEAFNNYLIQTSSKKRQYWAKNTLHDYIELCKVMLEELEQN